MITIQFTVVSVNFRRAHDFFGAPAEDCGQKSYLSNLKQIRDLCAPRSTQAFYTDGQTG
jgi:hypothetical protein